MSNIPVNTSNNTDLKIDNNLNYKEIDLRILFNFLFRNKILITGYTTLFFIIFCLFSLSFKRGSYFIDNFCSITEKSCTYRNQISFIQKRIIFRSPFCIFAISQSFSLIISIIIWNIIYRSSQNFCSTRNINCII